MEKEIQIQIEKLVYLSKEKLTARLGLCEVGGERRFSVTIGKPEADSISMFLSKAKLPRPLTHDLLKIIMYRLGGMLHKIVVTNTPTGLFAADMYIMANDEVLIVPSRMSDAVSMALRCDAPIFIEEGTLAYLSAVQEGNDILAPTIADLERYINKKRDLHTFGSAFLEQSLETFVQREEYEKAAIVRDELKRRKEEKNKPENPPIPEG